MRLITNFPLCGGDCGSVNVVNVDRRSPRRTERKMVCRFFFVTQTKLGQHNDDTPGHQTCCGLDGAIILNSRRDGWETLEM